MSKRDLLLRYNGPMSWKFNLTALKLKQPLESSSVAKMLGFTDDTEKRFEHPEIKMLEGGQLAIAYLNGYHILVNFDLCQDLVDGQYGEFEAFGAEEAIGGFIHYARSGFFVYREGELVRRYSENDEAQQVETEGVPLPFEAQTTWKRASIRMGVDASESSDQFSVEEAIFELLRTPLGGYYDRRSPEFQELEFQLFEEPFDEDDIAAQQRSWFRASGGPDN